MKKQIILAAVLSFIPVAAFAGTSIGIGYSNMGFTGHSGRAGITLTAGNLYSNNVIASGAASFARGYYNVHANIGKLLPAGGVYFEPYISMGFLHLNYNQMETGYNTVTQTEFGYSYTYQTPYNYIAPQSIQDSYGLFGANMNIPIGKKVALQFGGGYGHTLSVLNGQDGAVYKGKAEIAFEIARNVTANISVRYLHVPGAALTTEGAGISYHFA